MKVVLVHGNPETPAVWGPLCRHLAGRQVLTPQLPGFGTPTPAGFAAGWRDYVAWLTAELEALGEPVHLIGHDWGGALVVAVACERPDLIASWTTDVLGLFDPAYVWHDMAQLWQTPGAGEEAVAGMVSLTIEARTGMFQSFGADPETAAELAGAIDEEMGRCILALYRSASQPVMADYGVAHLAAAGARPGLVIAPSDDPYTGGTDLARRAAAAAGARLEELDGLGHWWMLGDPGRGAAVLSGFLDAVDAAPGDRG